MQRQTVLITGGTSGIGYQTAMQLAFQGMQVVISGRDKARGHEAVATLQSITRNSAIEYVCGDLATRAGIQSVASAYCERHQHLDVLIHNAGLACETRVVDADGLEKMYAVNVRAPWLLTHMLMPVLQASPMARVIAVTGGDHPHRIDEQRLQGEGEFIGLEVYSHTKLIMMAVMYEYAQRLTDTAIGVHVCYPGQASTHMTQQVTKDMLPRAMQLFWPLFRLAVRADDGRSAKRASKSSVYLATTADIQGKNGLYVDRSCRVVPWPAVVYDVALRTRLWNFLEHRHASSHPEPISLSSQ